MRRDEEQRKGEDSRSENRAGRDQLDHLKTHLRTADGRDNRLGIDTFSDQET